MTAAVCPVCDRPQDAGLLCSACCDVLERELRDVPDIVHNLNVTRAKMARIGAGTKGGLPSERTPIGWGAVDPRWVLENVLTTWARDVLAERFGVKLTLETSSNLAASMLLDHINDIRRHPAVTELVDELLDAIRNARRAIDRPAERQYLGQCLVPTPDEEGREVTCLAEVYARHGASEVTCGTCGVTHDVHERRASMLEQVEDMNFTIREASYVLGEIGDIKVSQASIRSYIFRKKLAYRPGGNMIRLGDLLTVVLDEGERRSA